MKTHHRELLNIAAAAAESAAKAAETAANVAQLIAVMVAEDEMAERPDSTPSKAIGRALNALGYGAQFSDAPHPEEPLQGREAVESSRPSARSEAQPQPEEPAERTTQPVVAARPVAAPVPGTATPVPGTATPDPELADYSWSAFWPWARERGLNGPREIEALIGQPVSGLTPAELRDRIVASEAKR